MCAVCVCGVCVVFVEVTLRVAAKGPDDYVPTARQRKREKKQEREKEQQTERKLQTAKNTQATAHRPRPRLRPIQRQTENYPAENYLSKDKPQAREAQRSTQQSSQELPQTHKLPSWQVSLQQLRSQKEAAPAPRLPGCPMLWKEEDEVQGKKLTANTRLRHGCHMSKL